jgi:hypothetical protein
LLQAYEGYLEKNIFYPVGQPMKKSGRYHVIITVLEEAVLDADEKPQAKAWREFFDEINASEEQIPNVFERIDLSREIKL